MSFPQNSAERDKGEKAGLLKNKTEQNKKGGFSCLWVTYSQKAKRQYPVPKGLTRVKAIGLWKNHHLISLKCSQTVNIK